jgi:hypothetical protein
MEEMTIPEGYKRNAIGHLVPIEQIDEIDRLRDDFVRKAVGQAATVSETLASYKAQLSGDMQAFLDLSSEKYQVKSGGAKGNVSLMSFDGRYKIIREIAERLDFDERLQAAKALIDECLREWTKYAGSEVRTLIEDAFQVDVKGRINTKRILSLRKLKIEHPTWQQAMVAIGEAVTVTGSCTYYRIYKRDENGKYHQLNLDFSGV